MQIADGQQSPHVLGTPHPGGPPKRRVQWGLRSAYHGGRAPTITRELTIGQLAERSGVATSALRFYEDQGLISSRRTSGNQRRYHRDTLRRVAFIKVSQNVGMPLNAIREALHELPEGRTPTKADWPGCPSSGRPISTRGSGSSPGSGTI